MYEPSHASPSRPERWNSCLGAISVPSRPLIDHRITRSRVIDTTSLSGCSSGLVAGWMTAGGAVCLSGSVVSICVRMMPAETDASRNSIRLVIMSRYGIRLSSPLSSSSCSTKASRGLIAVASLVRTRCADQSIVSARLGSVTPGARSQRRLVFVLGGCTRRAALDRGGAAIGQEVLEPQAERFEIGDDLLHRAGQQQMAHHADQR